MKTQLLPHYLKMPGLVLFILAFLPSFVAGAVDGFTLKEYDSLSEHTIHVLDIIGLIGITVYALSKEKVYDELLHRLRLEAIKLTFIASMVIILLIHVLSPETNLDPSYLINLQILGFLLIYYLKKENIVAYVEQS